MVRQNNGRIKKMKDGRQRQGSGAMALTVEEHLWLHRMMERRAHELWLEGGGRRRSALENWLRAEREVWGEFERMPGRGRYQVFSRPKAALKRAQSRRRHDCGGTGVLPRSAYGSVGRYYGFKGLGRFGGCVRMLANEFNDCAD